MCFGRNHRRLGGDEGLVSKGITVDSSLVYLYVSMREERETPSPTPGRPLGYEYANFESWCASRSRDSEASNL